MTNGARKCPKFFFENLLTFDRKCGNMLVVEEGHLKKCPSLLPGASWYCFLPGAKAYQKIPQKTF
jgi:hypothetical protein